MLLSGLRCVRLIRNSPVSNSRELPRISLLLDPGYACLLPYRIRKDNGQRQQKSQNQHGPKSRHLQRLTRPQRPTRLQRSTRLLRVTPPRRPRTPAAEDASKSKADEPAAAAPANYSRGEGQKPVTAAYRENWNAIFAKKTRARRRKSDNWRDSAVCRMGRASVPHTPFTKPISERAAKKRWVSFHSTHPTRYFIRPSPLAHLAAGHQLPILVTCGFVKFDARNDHNPITTAYKFVYDPGLSSFSFHTAGI